MVPWLLALLKPPRIAIIRAVTLGIVAIIGNTGFWLMPNLSTYYWVSQNLIRSPFEPSGPDYLYSSYLQPALFWLLGGRNLLLYIAYCLCFTLAFWIWYSLWFIRHHGFQVAIEESKLLTSLVFPVFFIPIYGIGMDGITLLLMLAIAINLRSRWAILPAILLGTQHFEQGLLAFFLLAVSIVWSLFLKADRGERGILRPLATVIGSLIAGKVILSAWFLIIQLDPKGDRLTFIQENWQEVISGWTQHLPAIAWSILGLGWVILFKEIRKYWPLLAITILVIFFTILVADRTRVGAIVLFPAVFYWILQDKTFWKTLTLKLSIALLTLYLLFPPVCVLWGYTYNSLWEYDRKLVRQVIENGGRVKDFDAGLPFRR